MDYKIWRIIYQLVYQTKVQDVNDLMQRLTDVWARVEQSVIKCYRAISMPAFEPQEDICNIDSLSILTAIFQVNLS